MKQHNLKPFSGSTKSKKRIGRGQYGGNFSGRGMKGQGARTGADSPAAFEGGQTPLIRRMPKLKGFKNPNRTPFRAVNVGDLNLFKDGATVELKDLVEKKLASKNEIIKLLGTGEVKVSLTITVNKASESAKKKIEKAGGTLKLTETVSKSK